MKDNVQWLHDGEAVQYEPKKWFYFRRDLSVGPEHDRFTLPNVPMIVSVSGKCTSNKLHILSTCLALTYLNIYAITDLSLRIIALKLIYKLAHVILEYVDIELSVTF